MWKLKCFILLNHYEFSSSKNRNNRKKIKNCAEFFETNGVCIWHKYRLQIYTDLQFSVSEIFHFPNRCFGSRPLLENEYEFHIKECGWCCKIITLFSEIDIKAAFRRSTGFYFFIYEIYHLFQFQFQDDLFLQLNSKKNQDQ